jgi:AraC family transcriptional regulator
MFQKHYRCTVGAYIRRLRIDFACRELANTEAPLVDIALAAGFCDQSHFTKTFRRHTGQVPSQFRESIR